MTTLVDGPTWVGKISNGLTLDEELEVMKWLLREESVFSGDEPPEKLANPKQWSLTLYK